MKTRPSWLLVMACLPLVHCSPREEKAKAAGSENGTEEHQEEPTGRHNFSRITEIHMGIAEWYSYMNSGSLILQDLSGVEMRPVWNRRRPIDIVAEHRSVIGHLDKKNQEAGKEAGAGLERWMEAQFDGLNCLRKTLGQPEITDRGKYDHRSILDLQEQALLALEREEEALDPGRTEELRTFAAWRNHQEDGYKAMEEISGEDSESMDDDYSLQEQLSRIESLEKRGITPKDDPPWNRWLESQRLAANVLLKHNSQPPVERIGPEDAKTILNIQIKTKEDLERKIIERMKARHQGNGK